MLSFFQKEISTLSMRTIGIAFILAHTTKYAVGSTDDNINNLENVCSYRTSDTNKLKACFGPLENVQCNVPEISDGSECKNLEETKDLFQQVYDGSSKYSNKMVRSRNQIH